MELPETDVARLLETWPSAILATSGMDGRPHQVPIVFVRHAERLWSPIDGKPKRGGELARVGHVRRDARVGLLLDHYHDDWRRLWWIRVDGDAAVVEPADDASFDDVARALTRKYPQYSETPLFQASPTLLRVDPIRILGWCADAGALA